MGRTCRVRTPILDKHRPVDKKKTNGMLTAELVLGELI